MRRPRTPRRSYGSLGGRPTMHRGVEIGLYLRRDLTDDNFVAGALGNLAAFGVANARKERLDWQVLRVNATRGHHYRLLLRHPDRVLDLGFKTDIERILGELSDESVEQLRNRLSAAERAGLTVRPLRVVHEEVDFWKDDFWNWLG
jgi:hypothetical protein